MIHDTEIEGQSRQYAASRRSVNFAYQGVIREDYLIDDALNVCFRHFNQEQQTLICLVTMAQ